MNETFNLPNGKDERRRLRREMPNAEALLWSRLRGRQLLGMKFRRQHGIGPYNVDFYCPEVRLAIELDGDSHFTPKGRQHDTERTRFIESFDIRVRRFTNDEVYDNLDGVLEAIAAAIRAYG